MASLSNINGLFDVHSTGAILFSTSHGTSGQILKSNGNAAPTWVDASTVIGGPYLPLTGGTLTGNLAINGTNTLSVGGTLSASNFSGSSSGTNTGDQTSVTGASGYLDTNRGTPSNAAQYWQAHNLGTTEAPSTDWYTTLRFGHGNPTTYYGNTLAIKMTGTGVGDIYTQNLQNGTFQGWKKYWNDANFNPASYLPLSGGTLTGALTGTSATFSGNVTAGASMYSPIYYDSGNGAYYGDFAGMSVFNKLNTGIGNLGSSRSVSYSMTSGNWYRIANGAGRSCGDIYIQDAISGGPHGNLTFYAGSSYSQYAGTMLKLKSSSFYNVIGFTEIRLLIGTTYQDQYVEIYCQRTGTYNITVQDTHSATNQWILSTSATVGSVPAGYSDSTRLDINGMLIAEAGNGSNRFAVDRVGAIHLSGGTSGSSGQVLTSGGTGSPTWTTPTTGTLTSLVAGTGISLTNASGPAVTVTATTQFGGNTFTSRNNTNPIAVDSATSNMSGYCNTSSAAGYADGGLFVAAYSSSWVSQIFSNFRTGEIAVRGKNSGTWQAWRTVWDSVNLPNPVQSSGVTSVATGSGLTGGTITSTGTLSVDSTVIRTSGNQAITGNTVFYPSSTSTSYQHAAIELMASSSGTSGTPPRISWHWGGVVASLITIEANGTIAVRNNPGNAYEQFKASIITATSNFSGNLTGNVTGNVTGSSGSCTGNSATATLATTATNANNVVITGYGNSTFTFYQSSGSFSGFSGWHNYYIGNHGNGSNYYNTIIAFPFWGSPRYSRLEGNVQRGPFEFWTSERTIVSTHDVTAPRYYDTNTTYYGDFASTSNINALTLVGTLSGQNGYFNQDLAVGFNSGAIGGKVNIQINSANGIGIKNNLNGKSGAQGLLQYTSASYASGGYNMIFQAAPPSGSDTNMLLCYLNGNIVNRFNSYGQYSDRKLKENIVDTTPKLEDVKKIRIRNFNFKDDPYKQIGVIAQEFEEVFPGLVEDKEVPDQDETTKTVKYSVLVPILVKAIQELEARVKELENK